MTDPAGREGGEPPASPPCSSGAAPGDCDVSSERILPTWIADVARARLGDRQAFTALYREFASTVHGIAIAHLAPQEAEDLVQDVFLQAMVGLEQLRENERFPGWLATLTRNRARDHMRRGGGRTLTGEQELDALEDEARGPSEQLEAQDESQLVLEALRELPETYREALALRLVEGLDGPRIAARLEMTHGSLRVHLHRGMKLLREALNRREADAGEGGGGDA